jgi:hypothetical protein
MNYFLDFFTKILSITGVQTGNKRREIAKKGAKT